MVTTAVDEATDALYETYRAALRLLPPAVRNVAFEGAVARLRQDRARSTSSLGTRVVEMPIPPGLPPKKRDDR
jgi:hypothetical protein